VSGSAPATAGEAESPQGTKTLTSAVKMLRVLEAVADTTTSTVTGVAAALGWSRGVAHQYLVTGVRSGWLARHGEQYVLSTKACAIGSAALAALGLTAAVRAQMHALVNALNEPISFAILDGDHPRIVERVEPDRALQVRRSSEEQRMRVGTSASGHVLLAYGGLELRDALRGAGIALPPEERYRQVRADGFAIIHGQWSGDDVTAVAVPIFSGGVCRGALSAITPSGRTDENVMRDHLCRARDDIENEGRFRHDR
jgi:DNA-binding IclR family transcriptional regulator